MNKLTPAAGLDGLVLRPARWTCDTDVVSQVDRLMSLAFFPGRAPRSDAYRQGCRAALEYRILGRSLGPGYPAGCCEADAWFAGVEEGHAIWRRKHEAANLTATDAKSSKVSQ